MSLSRSEMDRSFLLIQERTHHDYIEKAQTADFETAIHYSRYGKFQALLLAVCGTIYATCAISSTTLSFVLPSAKCDFNLSSVDKGKLSAMPLIGMIFGCSLWGSIADSQGRKVAIMLSLLVDFLAALISSFAQTFSFFLICRFFNGFGIIGATSIIFSYLGEFASKKHRDVMLGRLEVFWNVGVILLPGVAWVLLNRTTLDSFIDHGNFSPWRIFVLVCSIPSLISLVMLYFLPETPKFLISKGQYEKAKLVFQKVFTFNTGFPSYAYPVMTLEGEYENNNNSEGLGTKVPLREKICVKITSIVSETQVLFTQPYLKYLSVTCFADFGLMASYYTLIMWFPEIFDRFNQFEVTHPNSTASVCSVSNGRADALEVFFPEPCNPSIDNRVFLDTIIIGLSCVPTSVSLSFFMKKFGKKAVLIIGLVMSGLSTLSLNWVQSSTETLVLSCVFEALTSILEAVIFCFIVDLFPTNLRAIALAVTASSGRIGAIFGNVVFGLLIDWQCFVPIYLFGSLLIASGTLCLVLPQTDKYMVIQ
ncbi:synaptic vesicle glycoprotein 2B isoform X2 [Tribolium castaneum]|nr:PREDICTED: synaptic vesicle glycoprotein 2B isoform X2 [Tribolium castaneum]|eukprot:XP_973450.3 PREDICTED: synaptic vesicle glycoprotein 2B isoform X2 [Tribolium castaneum]